MARHPKTLALFLALSPITACQAMADESRMEWLPHPTDPTPLSYMQLQKTDDPSAVMELEFLNTMVHGEDTDFSLTFNGVSVKVFMEFNCEFANECATVIPQPGYIAIPPEISVRESEKKTVVIREYLGF